MRIALVSNPYRDKGFRIARSAEKLLRARGVEVVYALPFRIDGERTELPKHLRFTRLERALAKSELLLCFGGDGTILHAAKAAAEHEKPILGVNLGCVGFIAELEAEELARLTCLAHKRYTIEKRMMLDVTLLRDGAVIHRDLALNDAVVTKGAIARIVDLSVYGDDTLMSEFSGDGVIISTPTGSTAYSMSAGGPIVEPGAENLIITPICAHALRAKSFVLGAGRSVTVRVGSDARKLAYLSVDGGRAIKLTARDSLVLKKSERVTRLIKLSEKSFYDILYQKLGGTAQHRTALAQPGCHSLC